MDVQEQMKLQEELGRIFLSFHLDFKGDGSAGIADVDNSF